MAGAEETLRAAASLLEQGFCRDSVSRSYYAAFHAACAELTSRGIECKTHRGTLRMFNREFVKDGPLASSDSDLLQDAFTLRQSWEYESIGSADRDGATRQLKRAPAFVACIRELLE
jgi:uncharacterized protein (UPF0332 family)